MIAKLRGDYSLGFKSWKGRCLIGEYLEDRLSGSFV
jgi:hypothetical protein